MSTDLRRAWQTELHNRLMAPVEAKPRWRSIPAARREVEQLIANGLDGENQTRLHQLLSYLDTKAAEMAAAKADEA